MLRVVIQSLMKFRELIRHISWGGGEIEKSGGPKQIFFFNLTKHKYTFIIIIIILNTQSLFVT